MTKTHQDYELKDYLIKEYYIENSVYPANVFSRCYGMNRYTIIVIQQLSMTIVLSKRMRIGRAGLSGLQKMNV